MEDVLKALQESIEKLKQRIEAQSTAIYAIKLMLNSKCSIDIDKLKKCSLR